MPIAEAQLERMLLLNSVSDFLYREADLLDERRYTEWLDMLAEDYQYSVPLRMNVAYGETDAREQTRAGREICWFDEGKATMSLRVDQLNTGLHWAEEPVSRVSHLVTNIRLDAVELPEVEVSCRFLVYRNRVADETDFLVGRRKDRLRQVGDSWQVVRRELLLDQSVLLAKNLSIFV
ncbi:3-phenylpropionate/cinnamic acid dioxygenase subunit beta [Blastococcus sp. MG754426]|uniref:3-phenylpropionate/cinnamic acid dioxygenase subunit beta n=1 Tax=unclassified Blastococcus TaxID=2619396 RepID=UPI001EEFB5E2|nr:MULTISPECIES: 3-phenylpropionate/cinnamic acid dioxygenase subunit beta [unclassified Blastococcus]MCF6506422.1 3-phenylpropionate/cinnamic acid dioxygenase subunit beta [Blastococcus sp. MG754426]MCF6511293.1 3-phenylpropionate/cinnamic acid dioxygenase subunit beta [Blastococcus sp. MG754427]MCF6736523.1 3-phenylpropionate/cinnamic acid dioxygenase subunit beta [Blastococcus sp. KM273129]